MYNHVCVTVETDCLSCLYKHTMNVVILLCKLLVCYYMISSTSCKQTNLLASKINNIISYKTYTQPRTIKHKHYWTLSFTDHSLSQPDWISRLFTSHVTVFILNKTVAMVMMS